MEVAKEIERNKQTDRKIETLGIFIVKIRGRVRVRMKTMRVHCDEINKRCGNILKEKGLSTSSMEDEDEVILGSILDNKIYWTSRGEMIVCG